MSDSRAALEFDRVQQLVAAFARSARGRSEVLATLPRFEAGEGSRRVRLARELADVVAVAGPLPFSGLDHAGLLETTATGGVEPGDLLALMGLLRGVIEVRTALEAVRLGPELSQHAAGLPHLDAFLTYCEQRLGPDGEVLDTASPALAQARSARERHRRGILATLDRLRRSRAGLTAPFTVRRDRYCLPVPTSERQTVPGLVLDASATGATVFVEPFEVVEVNNALAEATARVVEEEQRVLAEMAAAFARRRDELLDAARVLTTLDAAQARLLFGEAAGGVLLDAAPGASFRLSQARHPLLDPTLAELRRNVLGEAGNTRPIVPLDFEFPADGRVVLLSGPNAGGKTVALKTIGLATLMADAGIPVLAEEGSTLPRLDRVWCHIGDEQSLFSDLSTFTGAMQATASILAAAGPETLVLYDELGAGTDPEEGAALAAALLEELVRSSCWAVATGHLVTVAAHVEQLPGAANAAMGYDEATGRPTYRFVAGLPGRSRGLDIAAACGVPPRLVARARSMLSQAYLALDTHLARLDREREAYLHEQSALAARQADAEAARVRLDEERDRLEAERRRLNDALAEEREKLRRTASERLDAVLAEIAAARARGELPGKRRQATLRRAAALEEAPRDAGTATGPLAVGSRVRPAGTRTVGTVGRVVGDRVEVLLGGKRLWVEAAACEPVSAAAAPPPAPTVVPAADDSALELKLIGLTEDEAREELERFLDRALLAGQRGIRVVHGHGSGVLRRMVHEVLSRHAAVVSFSHPPQMRGGTGVTEAELE